MVRGNLGSWRRALRDEYVSQRKQVNRGHKHTINNPLDAADWRSITNRLCCRTNCDLSDCTHTARSCLGLSQLRGGCASADSIARQVFSRAVYQLTNACGNLIGRCGNREYVPIVNRLIRASNSTRYCKDTLTCACVTSESLQRLGATPLELHKSFADYPESLKQPLPLDAYLGFHERKEPVVLPVQLPAGSSLSGQHIIPCNLG